MLKLETHRFYDLDSICDWLGMKPKNAKILLEKGVLNGSFKEGDWYMRGDQIVLYLKKKQREETLKNPKKVVSPKYAAKNAG